MLDREAIEAKLQEFAALKHNWDSYGAPPLDVTMIATAQAAVLMLPDDSPQPHLCPLSSGGVQLEWSSDKRSLEIGISEHGFDYLKETYVGDGVNDYEEAECGLDGVAGLVRWFACGELLAAKRN